jgi:hypothetical protein
MQPEGCLSSAPHNGLAYYIGPLHRRRQGITKTLTSDLLKPVAGGISICDAWPRPGTNSRISYWRQTPCASATGGISVGWATLEAIFLRFVLGLFFQRPLFSATWPGSFLGSFFPQERFFNNFPASFLGSFGFVFWTDHLLSITSRVRFLK